jgi:4a-hydroxytetrahydrobiopterin dehydratase
VVEAALRGHLVRQQTDNFAPTTANWGATNLTKKGATMAALSNEAIQQSLAKIQGWSYQGNELHKKFTFQSFMPGIEFVNKIAHAAESAGHHPDITINYNVVSIGLSTHSEGGVTEKDFNLAAKIDQVRSEIP